MKDVSQQFRWALKRMAQAQSTTLDTLRLNAALEAIDYAQPPQVQLATLCSRMGLDRPVWMPKGDATQLPFLTHLPEHGWLVVTSVLPNRVWQAVNADGPILVKDHELDVCRGAIINLRALEISFGALPFLRSVHKVPGFIGYVYKTLNLYKRDVLEACLATFFIGVLALATSLFSMQVYDRVIPTRSEYTLVILSSGVLLTILIELAMKYARSELMDHVIIGLDNRLSREIFSRLLSLRVDQLPNSVGSLAGQIRGYEQVRSFYTASTLFTLVDLPLGIIFIGLIVLIGHPVVAAVPLVFGIIALCIGLSIRARITQQAQDGAAFSNLKTGLLVEAVEGMETIKAGAGGWKFLSRWINVNRMTMQNDLKMRTLTDSVGYLSATIQQISYAGLVVAGAWAVMQGHMTMGALIACSIMSGRILTPVMAIPGLLVQHAHARAALEGLEKLYQLKTDNEDVERALTPEFLRGHYQLQEVKFSYGDNPPALVIPRLEIQPGERIAVLGPIGAGKSTLVRLLSGMYQPLEGSVLLDGLELTHIHRQIVSQHVGYLQQDHRLFQGTLRENLLIGMPDPGDETITQAMRRTGMDRLVASHPKGLERAIMEGGKGLSGGQRQLVAFTRLILTEPEIMLLDEPTATMDDEQEKRCLAVLAEEANKGTTMVIVTHKPTILPLATRIIVVVGSGIVLDGPRDAVLAQLRQPPSVAPSAQAERGGQGQNVMQTAGGVA